MNKAHTRLAKLVLKLDNDNIEYTFSRYVYNSLLYNIEMHVDLFCLHAYIETLIEDSLYHYTKSCVVYYLKNYEYEQITDMTMLATTEKIIPILEHKQFVPWCLENLY